MSKLKFVLFFLLISYQCSGTILRFAGANSVPDEFIAGNSYSEVETCPAGPYAFAYNGTTSVIEWGVGLGADVAPTSADGQIPPSTSVDLEQYVYWNGSDAFFIRSEGTGTIDNGYFILQCAGKN